MISSRLKLTLCYYGLWSPFKPVAAHGKPHKAMTMHYDALLSEHGSCFLHTNTVSFCVLRV